MREDAGKPQTAGYAQRHNLYPVPDDMDVQKVRLLLLDQLLDMSFKGGQSFLGIHLRPSLGTHGNHAGKKTNSGIGLDPLLPPPLDPSQRFQLVHMRGPHQKRLDHLYAVDLHEGSVQCLKMGHHATGIDQIVVGKTKDLHKGTVTAKQTEAGP